MTAPTDKLLTPAELADYLGTTTGNLAQFRYRGTGPAFVKVGRRVLYRESDVTAWIAANVRTMTGTAA
ncbi:AlpA family transcriptional regulator [uncultured Kocuria sp.]|uniref:helix-turn-helix transcriptional regulator n=1 Tax=uncultured Kocuria sp. TaxID=259305 RepID=UPI002627502E|nr:helix-turn-helix domain-containing protein [uncultured Kocuria sp.]